MNRNDLQRLSEMRAAEAEVLLKAGHYAGADYLMGYAVECALKACYAKQVSAHDFPDRITVNSLYKHGPKELIGPVGVESKIVKEAAVNLEFAKNWALVKDWNAAVRYNTCVDQKMSEQFCSACTSSDGVLTWIRERW